MKQHDNRYSMQAGGRITSLDSLSASMHTVLIIFIYKFIICTYSCTWYVINFYLRS
jgi:hypothetical protein